MCENLNAHFTKEDNERPKAMSRSIQHRQESETCKIKLQGNTTSHLFFEKNNVFLNLFILKVILDSQEVAKTMQRGPMYSFTQFLSLVTFSITLYQFEDLQLKDY